MSTEPSKNIVKVMLFGTFDGLHPGHLNFFKQARRLAAGKARLVVSIARDANVFRIKKRYPIRGERERLKILRATKLLDRVVLGGEKNYLAHIVREKPDIIALGYDQKAYVKNLRENLAKKGLKVKIVRLKPYKKEKYKSSLLNR